MTFEIHCSCSSISSNRSGVCWKGYDDDEKEKIFCCRRCRYSVYIFCDTFHRGVFLWLRVASGILFLFRWWNVDLESRDLNLECIKIDLRYATLHSKQVLRMSPIS